MSEAAFIAVDWGTSSFRLWVVGMDGNILAQTDGPFGMSQLKRSDFGAVLEDSLSNMNIAPDVPAVICGMAGAAQGWCETPYLKAPTKLDALGARAVKVKGSKRDVRILPGVKQMSPANVMRGEETQVAGLLNTEPTFNGTVCMPGTHTKWVRIIDQAICDFETCMTGEQFAFFSKTSVLSHSMVLDGWNDTAFVTAVQNALDEPCAVPCKLFAIRAEMLIAEQSAGEARARLSGLLIGQELMATQRFWQNNVVTVIGAAPLCTHYQQALSVLGVTGTILDTTKMTLSGLGAAFEKIER